MGDGLGSGVGKNNGTNSRTDMNRNRSGYLRWSSLSCTCPAPGWERDWVVWGGPEKKWQNGCWVAQPGDGQGSSRFRLRGRGTSPCLIRMYLDWELRPTRHWPMLPQTAA